MMKVIEFVEKIESFYPSFDNFYETCKNDLDVANAKEMYKDLFCLKIINDEFVNEDLNIFNITKCTNIYDFSLSPIHLYKTAKQIKSTELVSIGFVEEDIEILYHIDLGKLVFEQNRHVEGQGISQDDFIKFYILHFEQLMDFTYHNKPLPENTLSYYKEKLRTNATYNTFVMLLDSFPLSRHPL